MIDDMSLSKRISLQKKFFQLLTYNCDVLKGGRAFYPPKSFSLKREILPKFSIWDAFYVIASNSVF